MIHNLSLKRFCPILILLLWLPSGSPAQQPDEGEVLSLQNAYCKAVEHKDEAFLNTLFHESMVITGGSGMRRNKQEEIRDALDPRYELSYFRSRDTEVNVYKDTAIVRGDLYWELKNNGEPLYLERRYTFVYVRFGNTWQIVSQHIGLVPRE